MGYRDRLARDLDRWIAAGWVAPGHRDAILGDVGGRGPNWSATGALAILGAVLLALAGLQLLTLLISEAAWRIGAWLQWEGFVSGHEHLLFLVRIQLIGLLVWVMLLRYFFLQQQWQQQVAAAAEAKLLALQARIRPHFLFNCLNSLVALIPQRPAEAERLVEKVPNLFIDFSFMLIRISVLC